MAQTAAVFYQEGMSIDYTPTAAVTAGDVVLIGTIPMIAPRSIEANALGALAIEGVYKVPKASGVISAGDAIYWDVDGNPVVGTALSGACSGSAAVGYLMGFAVFAALTGDKYTYVALRSSKGTATVAGSMTADDITGTDSSLGINGLQAAQGGAILVTGGVSTTSGNAGGAVGRVGGTPGVTGVGGAITDTGGAGGSTSGAGGALSRTGGAGTAGNAAGGAISDTGGAGQGSAAGGAVGQTGGVGGATGAGGALNYISGAGGSSSGAAGAINITVGACTSGNGAALTLTAGNGAGGTNAGGDLNCVPGAAVSTGTPGKFKINADANLMTVMVALTATDASRAVFIAPRAMRLEKVTYMHTTGSTSGTLTVEKLTGTTAAGSGTDLLTGTIDLSATTVANTATSGTLISTVASLTFAAGNRASVKIAGTMTNLAGAIAVLSFSAC